MTIIKTCSCGHEYSQVGWEELPRLGIQEAEGDRYDLRQCTRAGCGTTVARELSEGTSVCVGCGTWIERGERKSVSANGVECSECAARYTVFGAIGVAL